MVDKGYLPHTHTGIQVKSTDGLFFKNCQYGELHRSLFQNGYDRNYRVMDERTYKIIKTRDFVFNEIKRYIKDERKSNDMLYLIFYNQILFKSEQHLDTSLVTWKSPSSNDVRITYNRNSFDLKIYSDADFEDIETRKSTSGNISTISGLVIRT